MRNVPYVREVKKGPSYDRHLTVDEAAALFDACESPHMLMFFVLAFNTAARPGAILELTTEQVDLENRLIHLNPTGRDQTKKYRPTVPISEFLLPWLKEADARHFVNYFGRPICSNRKGFEALRTRAGLGKDVVRKIIRHTMAVEMRRRGVTKWEVEGFLGHSGEKSTTDVYAKYAPDFLSKSVAAIDDYMNEISQRVKRPLVPNRLKELRASDG
ncbi:site-specific integrase [Magnetovibrio sp. PR-2]|uniref:site-specific integrase n=1 Tax=Magnetovibrio sp. PR-2 TaxID=3120356 RepID=UPI002FCDEB05